MYINAQTVLCADLHTITESDWKKPLKYFKKGNLTVQATAYILACFGSCPRVLLSILLGDISTARETTILTQMSKLSTKNWASVIPVHLLILCISVSDFFLTWH